MSLDPVMATNDDATSCKRYAVQKGYWQDPVIQYFAKSAERKAPEINRGYFARVQAVKYLIDKFIKDTGGNCQLVNLGAGFDTLYWRLKSEGKSVKSFVEVDLAGVTSRKVYYIRTRKPLLTFLASEDEEVKFSSSELHAGSYHLVSADLRQLSELQTKLQGILDATLPTAFVAECVLVYVEVARSSALLAWIASHFSSAVFINYEQVNMEDKFGQVMIDNLKKRECDLSGVGVCKDLRSQEERFTSCGWSCSEAWDMNVIYHSLPKDEIRRIEHLEFLDEGELLEQLLLHYCITVARNGWQESLDFKEAALATAL